MRTPDVEAAPHGSFVLRTLVNLMHDFSGPVSDLGTLEMNTRALPSEPMDTSSREAGQCLKGHESGTNNLEHRGWGRLNGGRRVTTGRIVTQKEKQLPGDPTRKQSQGVAPGAKEFRLCPLTSDVARDVAWSKDTLIHCSIDTVSTWVGWGRGL